MEDTKARRLLKKRLERHGMQTWLARALEIGQPPISRWLSGETRPEPVLRAAIELLFPEIKAQEWLTDAERAFLERVRQFAKAA